MRAAALALVALAGAAAVDPDGPAWAQRRWVVAFANATEDPGVTLEGTGFTGPEIRESFRLAAREYPIDLVLYDNQRDDARAIANAEAANRTELHGAQASTKTRPNRRSN